MIGGMVCGLLLFQIPPHSQMSHLSEVLASHGKGFGKTKDSGAGGARGIGSSSYAALAALAIERGGGGGGGAGGLGVC